MTLTIAPTTEHTTRRLLAALPPYGPASAVHLHDPVVMSSCLAAQALVAMGVLRSLPSERR